MECLTVTAVGLRRFVRSEREAEERPRVSFGLRVARGMGSGTMTVPAEVGLRTFFMRIGLYI